MPKFLFLFHQFAKQHHELDPLLQGKNVSELGQRPLSGKWSIHEHVAHLGRYQEIFQERCMRILTEDSPAFARYRAEDDPGFSLWCNKDWELIRIDLLQQRVALIEKLGELSEEDWQRSGSHPKLGRLPLHEWLRFFVLHESHHFYSIFWLIHTS
ncbi:MAG: DinB family protein [Bacteroidota bacterium]